MRFLKLYYICPADRSTVTLLLDFSLGYINRTWLALHKFAKEGALVSVCFYRYGDTVFTGLSGLMHF